MDHHEQHHQHHEKEREERYRHEKEAERRAEKSPRSIHPAWFVAIGVALVLLVLALWMTI
jgi:hypothetical protein